MSGIPIKLGEVLAQYLLRVLRQAGLVIWDQADTRRFLSLLLVAYHERQRLSWIESELNQRTPEELPHYHHNKQRSPPPALTQTTHEPSNSPTAYLGSVCATITPQKIYSKYGETCEVLELLDGANRITIFYYLLSMIIYSKPRDECSEYQRARYLEIHASHGTNSESLVHGRLSYTSPLRDQLNTQLLRNWLRHCSVSNPMESDSGANHICFSECEAFLRNHGLLHNYAFEKFLLSDVYVHLNLMPEEWKLWKFPGNFHGVIQSLAIRLAVDENSAQVAESLTDILRPLEVDQKHNFVDDSLQSTMMKLWKQFVPTNSICVSGCLVEVLNAPDAVCALENLYCYSLTNLFLSASLKQIDTRSAYYANACKLRNLNELVKLVDLLRFAKFYLQMEPCVLAFFFNSVLIDNLDNCTLFRKLVLEQLKLWLICAILHSRGIKFPLDEYQLEVARLTYSIRNLGEYDSHVLTRLSENRRTLVGSHKVEIEQFFRSSSTNFTRWTHKKFLLYLFELLNISIDLDILPHLELPHMQYTSVGVEHIQPRCPEQWVNAIGNLVILDNRANSGLGNKHVRDKSISGKPGSFCYDNSPFVTVRSIPTKYNVSRWSDCTVVERSHSIGSFFMNWLVRK